MRRRIKRLPSPALVVGVVALVAALGGTATALKGQNTVGKDDVKKGAIDAKDIAKDAVGLSEIAMGAEDALSGRWALVNELGQIEAQSGGFTLVNCYQANGNCYINAGEDVRDNGIQATIGINNTDASPILSGETGAAACGLTSVACAPPGTELNDVLVVAPRDSTGAVPGGVTPPPPGDAARFYVHVSE